MSNPDRRKDRKLKKERLLAKKLGQRRERQQQQHEEALRITREVLRDLLVSGTARVAIATLPDGHNIVAAFWENTGVRVQVYDGKDLVSLEALTTAALEHVDDAQWVRFFDNHLQSVMDAPEGKLPLSMIQWKPGENPLLIKPDLP